MRAHFVIAPPRPHGPSNYPHQAIALAEGLTELGWDVGANADWWREDIDASPLFRERSEQWAQAADLVIIDENWRAATGLPIPAWVTSRQRSHRAIGLDYGDVGTRRPWCYEPEASDLDLVLRSHSSRGFRYPANVRPWAFGLTHRILRAVGQTEGVRDSTLMWNFQHKDHPHTVRLWAEQRLLSHLSRRLRVDGRIMRADGSSDAYEALMWHQTCGRHSDAYYRALRTSTSIACMGGWFVPGFVRVEGSALFRLGRRLMHLARRPAQRVSQWDSWRLWEGLVAGCCCVMLNIRRFGLSLPVEPIEGEHYIGVDGGTSPEQLAVRLSDADTVARIGRSGRAWAIENYSPLATAQRALRLVNLA